MRFWRWTLPFVISTVIVAGCLNIKAPESIVINGSERGSRGDDPDRERERQERDREKRERKEREDREKQERKDREQREKELERQEKERRKNERDMQDD